MYSVNASLAARILLVSRKKYFEEVCRVLTKIWCSLTNVFMHFLCFSIVTKTLFISSLVPCGLSGVHGGYVELLADLEFDLEAGNVN